MEQSEYGYGQTQNYGYQQPYPQNFQYPQFGQFPVRKQTNPLAIASMICSLASLMVAPSAIVGIILGFVALHQVNSEPERYEGKPFALAGIIIGFVMVGLYAIFILFYLFMIFAMLNTSW
ncbi:MAG: DUF4190 domain-containing protein [Candidatus Thermoplasmatota archaeon]|nr:DUF4190 domain-containing protein [Candidatus Thermoplasmatota archaeon]